MGSTYWWFFALCRPNLSRHKDNHGLVRFHLAKFKRAVKTQRQEDSFNVGHTFRRNAIRAMKSLPKKGKSAQKVLGIVKTI
jgi:hypothetical protein